MRWVDDVSRSQPTIRLLAPEASVEARREAALLVGQFAQDRNWKHRIAARNVIPALVRMLRDPGPGPREIAAFALGRLALDPDAKASVVLVAGSICCVAQCRVSRWVDLLCGTACAASVMRLVYSALNPVSRFPAGCTATG